VPPSSRNRQQGFESIPPGTAPENTAAIAIVPPLNTLAFKAEYSGLCGENHFDDSPAFREDTSAALQRSAALFQ
jgi:hypothetical protein